MDWTYHDKIVRSRFFPLFSLLLFNPVQVHLWKPSVVKKSFISLPYFGASIERIARILKPHNIHTAFRFVCQVRNLLFNSKLKTPPLNLLGVDYLILFRDCDLVYDGEIGHTAGIRLKEHKRSFEKWDLRCKIIIHSLNTDLIPSFGNIKILDTSCKYYEARIFLES